MTKDYIQSVQCSTEPVLIQFKNHIHNLRDRKMEHISFLPQTEIETVIVSEAFKIMTWAS